MINNTDTISSLRRILEIFQNSDSAIRPHFILTGPSGSGKSHTMAMLADLLGINMFEINAAQLTKEGTSGNSLSKALTPLMQTAGQPTICFVDEFDKLFVSGNSNSELAHETTNGVQNEFLKVLESDTASVFGDYGKYVNVLFVFAGAFNGEENIDLDRLREFGIKTEFLGRVGLAFSLEKLTLADLENILINSPLLANYLALFPDVDRNTVISAVMSVLREHHEKNTLGARMVNTLIHQYFILGGLQEKQTKKTTFQKTLTFAAA